MRISHFDLKAEAVKIDQATTARWINDFRNNLISKEFLKYNFQDDFEIQNYNIWSYAKKTNLVNPWVNIYHN